MGLFKVSQLFESRHIVSDSSGGNIDIFQLRDRLRANGFTRPDIFVNHGSEYLQFSFVHDTPSLYRSVY
jgi:hypothetical protein